MKLFTNHIEGIFKSRPNRFIVLVEVDSSEIATDETPTKSVTTPASDVTEGTDPTACDSSAKHVASAHDSATNATGATNTTLVRCHCPNPGRLWELLLPGVRVILQRNKPGGVTTHTLVAVYSRGLVVPLYAAKANQVTEKLIIPKLFPEALRVEHEVKYGKSRFDFRVTLPRGGGADDKTSFTKDATGQSKATKTLYIEVKSCSLIEYRTAMFPDAPSDRASRHIRELAELSTGTGATSGSAETTQVAQQNQTGEETAQSINTLPTNNQSTTQGHVIFVIQSPYAEEFIPNIHTDPTFAQTMVQCQHKVTYHGVSIRTEADGRVAYHGAVPINLTPVTPLVSVKPDSGVYMILLKIPQTTDIQVGKLGEITFQAGYYVYTGSAKAGLSKRVQRHLAKRKKKHWHMDYLMSHATWKKGVPIYTELDLECAMAKAVGEVAEEAQQQTAVASEDRPDFVATCMATTCATTAQTTVPGFGCSDCDCQSHLFYFAKNPLEHRKFLDLLFLLRHKGFSNHKGFYQT